MAPLTLQSLLLSTTAFTAGGSAGDMLATITGQTAGSEISISPADTSFLFAVNGAGTELLKGLNWPATAASIPAVRLTETLKGATGSPKNTAIAATISPFALTAKSINANALTGMSVGTITGVGKGDTLALSAVAPAGTLSLSGAELLVGATVETSLTTIAATITRTTLGGGVTSYPISVQAGVPVLNGDTLSGAANAALESRTTTTGGLTWTPSTPGAFVFTGSGSVRPATNINGLYATFDCGFSDYMLSCGMSSYALDAGTCSLADLVFRYRDPLNFWTVEVDARYDQVTINRTVDGAATQRLGYSLVFASGAALDIRVRCTGPTITLFVNGIEAASLVDDIFETETRVGIYVGVGGSPGANYATFSNLFVAPAMGTAIAWPNLTPVSTVTPQIPLGPSGSYDSTDANDPNVVYDPVNNRYVLDYSGYHNTGTDNYIQYTCFAYAENIDGPWIKDPTNPQVIPSGIGAAAANGGLVYNAETGLWILVSVTVVGGSYDAIELYTSPDLSTWTDFGTLFTPSGWKSAGYFDPSLRKLADGTFEMWYCGQDSGGNRSFGRATSPTGIVWTEDANNPILSPLTTGNGALYNEYLGEPFALGPTQVIDNSQVLLAFDGVPLAFAPPGDADVYRCVNFGASLDFGATWRQCIRAYPPAGTGFMSAQTFDSDFIDIGDGTLRFFHSGSNLPGAALDLNIQVGEAKAPSVTALPLSYVPAAASVPTSAVVKASPNPSGATIVLTAAHNGSPLTTFTLYRGLLSDGSDKADIATVAVPTGYSIATYTDSGLVNGTAYYYFAVPNNAYGAGLISAGARVVPVVTPAHYFNATPDTQAYAPSTSPDLPDGYIDLQFWGTLASYATDGQPFFTRWQYGTASPTNADYYFGMHGTAGSIWIVWYGADGGAFANAISTAAWSAAYPFCRAQLNVTSRTIDGIASGTCVFSQSVDGITWIPLGSTITGLGSGGIAQNGTAANAPVVGEFNSSNPLTAQVNRVLVYNSAGALVFGPDFTTQPSGTTAFSDLAGIPFTTSPGAQT